MQRRLKNTGNRSDEPRIPLSFQLIFLQGNRGVDVHEPPPQLYKKWWQSRKPNCKNDNSKQCEVIIENVKVTESAMTFEKVEKPKPKPIPTLSPQQYLDGLVKSHGYSNSTLSTLSCAYYNKPSPLQRASYGVYVVDMIQQNNADGLQQVINIGLSPNACNAHSESIVHKVCQLSKHDDCRMLDVLLDAGCEVQICDTSGRTPLHNACWAPEPNFTIVERLLERDIQLFYMADQHGHLPLSYTRKEHWSDWLQFLQSKKDIYWPRTNQNSCNDPMMVPSSLPDVTIKKTNLVHNMSPNTRRIVDPIDALSTDLAAMVASGRLKPKEVKFLIKTMADDDIPYQDIDDSDFLDDEEEEEEVDCSSGYEYDESTSEYDDDDDDDDETEPESESKSSVMYDDLINDVIHGNNDTTIDIDASSTWVEMENVLQHLLSPSRRPIDW